MPWIGLELILAWLTSPYWGQDQVGDRLADRLDLCLGLAGQDLGVSFAFSLGLLRQGEPVFA